MSETGLCWAAAATSLIFTLLLEEGPLVRANDVVHRKRTIVFLVQEGIATGAVRLDPDLRDKNPRAALEGKRNFPHDVHFVGTNYSVPPRAEDTIPGTGTLGGVLLLHAVGRVLAVPDAQ